MKRKKLKKEMNTKVNNMQHKTKEMRTQNNNINVIVTKS